MMESIHRRYIACAGAAGGGADRHDWRADRAVDAGHARGAGGRPGGAGSCRRRWHSRPSRPAGWWSKPPRESGRPATPRSWCRPPGTRMRAARLCEGGWTTCGIRRVGARRLADLPGVQVRILTGSPPASTICLCQPLRQPALGQSHLGWLGLRGFARLPRGPIAQAFTDASGHRPGPSGAVRLARATAQFPGPWWHIRA